MNDNTRYDIITIGAGHAGCEAALAGARMGCKVMMTAINIDRIAHMPCNPSIGGIGKGQLVREVDALGGEMGRNIDATLVQIKTLNGSKGPAVQALRAQADKRQYSRLMKAKILAEPKIGLRQGEVVAIERAGEEELQVRTADGATFTAKCVIVATGTFLKGEMVIGEIKRPGGRAGESASSFVSGALQRLGLELGRFQSATPPRIWAGSIDATRMIAQPGDVGPLAFSFAGAGRRGRRQKDCYLTYTNKKTHKVIADNLHLSPIKSGSVSAKGPRYCPSIDRKVINFPDRDRHPVFVEPEGWENEELYLQGLTTSMPITVQEKIIRSVEGLEQARIMRPGYAVAYDFVLPHQLKNTLESNAVPGLFAAGQINGTSGYEEAAAQGLIAGINAALKCLGKEPLIVERSQAYIGVLIDDLVTKEIDEPYRMFTSRAEYRLVLRSDNADIRLTPIGHRLGLISDGQMEKTRKKRRGTDECLAKLKATSVRTLDLPGIAVVVAASPAVLKAIDLLRRPEVTIDTLAKIARLGKITKESRHQAEIETKYEGYIKRQLDQIAAQKRLEGVRLPSVDYARIEALSMEARQKLARIKPQSLGQAARIAGVTPADISILMVAIRSKTPAGGEN
ncbi:MAG: tRNA uridine-5-carboxymethylaminomethyl(34) synthesis enzyme MnmG [Actinomycetota bacterium]|nr:tRNA uridine-5-carboxymethylaminomethyl(34) synthesis enzyme MnmG [Actinomycetota bacterium]